MSDRLTRWLATRSTGVLTAYAVLVAFTMLFTTLLAQWETRDLRRVLKQIRDGEPIDPALGELAGRQAVIFPSRHHFYEACFVPLTTCISHTFKCETEGSAHGSSITVPPPPPPLPASPPAPEAPPPTLEPAVTPPAPATAALPAPPAAGPVPPPPLLPPPAATGAPAIPAPPGCDVPAELPAPPLLGGGPASLPDEHAKQSVEATRASAPWR